MPPSARTRLISYALDSRCATAEGMHAYIDDVIEEAIAALHLVGNSEVAEILNVTTQRVIQLAADHPDFPLPFIRFKSGRLWTRASIEEFEARRDHTPNRRDLKLKNRGQ